MLLYVNINIDKLLTSPLTMDSEEECMEEKEGKSKQGYPAAEPGNAWITWHIGASIINVTHE